MAIIQQQGASHDGAVLEATKTTAENAGVIVTLELRCMKNWGGTSSGAAFVQMVGVETRQYQQSDMRCTVEGGVDGATKTNSEKQGFFFANVKTVVIISSLAHQETSNWHEWESSVENIVKRTVNGIIDKITDPKTIIQAAISAGLAATVL